MTPLQRAIISDPSKDSSVARLLLRHGAALESRNDIGATAVMDASGGGQLELARLMTDAGADLRAKDFRLSTCLHFAALGGQRGTFAWLLSCGLELHTKNSFGRSAAQYAMCRPQLTPFLLSFSSAIDEIDPITYVHPERMIIGAAWLNQHFKLYLRRLGRDRLRAIANPEPRDTWSPLCISAVIDLTLAVTNLLQLGADIDFEGSPSGSALMAACFSGRLESVKVLVRHGAAISYLGINGARSAIKFAKTHKTITAWLLVKRFTDQNKLSASAPAGSSIESLEEVQPWSGTVKAELVITGKAERQVQESARGYWHRLMAVKKGWRGKVVPQQTTAVTHRRSRLIPEEPVRICPGDYGVPKKQP